MENKIYIGEGKTIRNIQQEFNEVFPYLKLEFFSEVPGNDELLPASSMVSSETKLRYLVKKPHSTKISIDSRKTVCQLKEEFEKKFGLHILVFRRTGKIWIAARLTGNWTLQKQNLEGAEMSSMLQKTNIKRIADDA